MHTILSVWHAQLDKEPENFALRGLMADWYEDHRQYALAAAIREQIRKGWRPTIGTSVHCKGRASFWDLLLRPSRVQDPFSDLPHAVFCELFSLTTKAHPTTYPTVCVDETKIWFNSRRVAEEALWQALVVLAAKEATPAQG